MAALTADERRETSHAKAVTARWARAKKRTD
jgi:hypothetical protein